jgi:hypothetical protein
MFYDHVSDLFQDLENLSLEKNLIENLKLIAYSCDSSRQDDFGKYFRGVLDRVRQLGRSRDLHYANYILFNIMIFLKEVKNYNEELFKDEENLKLMSGFFDLLEKILAKSKSVIEENLVKQKEIVEILENNFSDEYYYRKNNKLLPKQLNLPF